MRTALFLFCAVPLLLASCQPRNKQAASDAADTATAYVPYDYSRLEGIYSGDFGGTGDIRVVLRHVTARQAVGYNIHKGLKRNFSGTVLLKGPAVEMELSEPGDNPYDGVFTVRIDTGSKEMKGTWAPANKKELGEKSFTLARQEKKEGENEYGSMYSYMSDSTGDFSFEPNGQVIYRYYPVDANGKKAEQYEEIKGNWKDDGNNYIIDWQPNKVFPTPRSRFRKVKYDEQQAEYYYLEGEGRKIEPQLAG